MAEPDAPELDARQRALLVQALYAWVARIDNPERKRFSFGDRGVFSATELADLVERDDPAAYPLYQMIRYGMEVAPFEEIIDHIQGEAPVV